jgi:glycine cleavage system H protein
MKIDTSLQYSDQHIWIRPSENGEFFAGITDYAQDLLGDIVFIEFPPMGSALTAEQPCGLVESVKTGSDLHAPMTGTVTEINQSLENNPEKINDAPYQSWIFKFKANDISEAKRLLSADQYQAQFS